MDDFFCSIVPTDIFLDLRLVQPAPFLPCVQKTVRRLSPGVSAAK